MQDAATRIAQLARELSDKVEQLEQLRIQLQQQGLQLQQQREQIEQLKQLVAQLKEQIGRNSSNSSLPPSSDSRETREKIRANRKRGKKKRKRGGQPGHRGSTRQLLPPEQVQHITDLFPQQCENCWRPLPKVPDEQPQRYQVTELPPIMPETTEFRQHAVGCTCGHITRAALPPEVAASPFGPRLSSIVAALTGVYHLSRRQAQTMLSDLFGIQISLGAISSIEARVSDALAPPWQQAYDSVQDAQVKHADGTSWRQGGKPQQLWVVATTLATVFMVVADGSASTLRLVLSKLKGMLISDRAKALNFWAMTRRQICWAHLLRKFVSFSERDGPASGYGKQMLQYTGIMFEMYYAYKDAKITREEFRRRMQPLREQFEALLQRAVDANIKGLSGSCADILYHREALWAFVDKTGIEPTNNHAEQQLRAFVLWRRRSFGTQSERGNRFAERIMTVVYTARKQGRHVLSYLTAVCEASRTGQPTPPLLQSS